MLAIGKKLRPTMAGDTGGGIQSGDRNGSATRGRNFHDGRDAAGRINDGAIGIPGTAAAESRFGDVVNGAAVDVCAF